MFPIDSGCKHCRSRCTRLARRTDGTGPLLAHHGAVAHAAACLRVPVGIFLRPGRLTLRFTCTGERDSRVHATEDRRSPVSGASVCWALVVAQGCAGTSRPPRPTPARRTTPPRLGSPPPAWVPRRARHRQARATRLLPACCRGRRSRRRPPAPRAPGDAPRLRWPVRRKTARPRPSAGGSADPGQARQRPPPAHTARGRDPRAGLRRPCGTGPARPGKTGGLPRPWGATLRAVRSPHAMAERRPASGDAPTRGETPSQAEQSLLVLGVCS